MKTGARLPSLLLFLAVLPFTSAHAQDPARLDEIVNAYAPERFMGNVLVVRGDEVVLDKSYGHANLEWNIPHTVDSKFRIGSITKQFTAAAILLLEEQGKLETRDPVSTHLPGTPEEWKDITIHHLLSHESGIPDIARLPWFNENVTRPTTTAELIDVFRDLPLDFTPGSEFRYSNSGYMVLGRLVELVSGDSYANFVRDNIFIPLGMTNSGYDSNAEVIAHRAAGYSPGPNGLVNAPYLDMSVPQGAGGLYSTTGDLRRWSEGLFGGKLLSAASLDKMTTPNLGDYAYGVDVTLPDGRKRVRHNGGIQGFNAAMAYYPDEKLLVVALSNINGNAPDVLIAHLADVMHGKEVVLPSEWEEISLTDAVLQQYVGTYLLAPNFALSVTVEDGQLVTQATNQPQLPIYAASETLFFLKVVEATIEFQKNDSGVVTGLILTQNGRSMPAQRQ